MELYYKKLQRHEECGHVRFLTFSCYHRLSLFGNDRIKQLFVNRLQIVTDQSSVKLIAWVIMPEHIHLLLLPDVADITMRDYLQSLKRPIAISVLKRWRQLNADILQQVRDKRGREHFWQSGGGYDRNIYTASEYEEKLNYIHHNPVERDLADRAQDWMWSSARYYLGDDYHGPTITPVEI